MDINRSNDNSNPISNKKKTIPNSPRESIIWTSFTHFNPHGPNNVPVIRNPNIGEVFSILNNGIIVLVAINNIKLSNLAPCIL